MRGFVTALRHLVVSGIAGSGLALLVGAALAAEPISFPSLSDGQIITAYYQAADGEGQHPAVVLLHGCGGLIRNGGPSSFYQSWRDILGEAGYAVLMVDSAGSRGFGSTCGGGTVRKAMYEKRPGDAYAALNYLQALPEVDPSRISLIGWSQGGGIVLLTVSSESIGRPQPAPSPDFRAAVAFYPAACSKRLQSRPFTHVEPGNWSTVAPLLVLQGGADNWTLAAPCKTFVDSVRELGEDVEIVVYPDAVHSFDAPNMPVHERLGLLTASGKPPLVGTDPEAREDAIKRVIAFLDQANGKP